MMDQTITFKRSKDNSIRSMKQLEKILYKNFNESDLKPCFVTLMGKSTTFKHDYVACFRKKIEKVKRKHPELTFEYINVVRRKDNGIILLSCVFFASSDLYEMIKNEWNSETEYAHIYLADETMIQDSLSLFYESVRRCPKNSKFYYTSKGIKR